MRHTGLTGKGVARNRRGHLRGERRGPSRGGGCWKSGCHAAAQQSRKSEHNGVITLADVAVFMTTWTQGNGENEERWLPWSSLVSALTSQVPFCVKTCAWCHLCYALESSPALHHPPASVPYLYPSCPPQWAPPKCKLGQGSCPRRPIYYGWRKTQWPQVTEENSEAMNAVLFLLLQFVWSLQQFQCLNTQRCNNLRLSAFSFGSARRFLPIMLAPSLVKSRAGSEFQPCD